MNIIEKSHLQLEILIATMNRNSLDFLDDMFKKADISECQLLIVNQTTPEALLNTDKSNVRIINSFEIGLSKSRNLALQNAKSDIVLITDDDVVFEKDFQKIILNAFSKYNDAGILSFKVVDQKGRPYRKYPQQPQRHSISSIENIMSVEIALNLKALKNKNLEFDERFGLGSEFQTGEEYLFVRSAIGKGLKAYFWNDFILAHSESNSGQEAGSDRIVYARAALMYHIHKHFAYIWVPKYVFFLLRHRLIGWNEINQKFALGLKGIKAYQTR